MITMVFSKSLHKTHFVIQSVSDESRISSIKKEIAAVAVLLRNDVQVFCAINYFRVDSAIKKGLRKIYLRHREHSVAISILSHISWGFFAHAQNDGFSFCVNRAKALLQNEINKS